MVDKFRKDEDWGAPSSAEFKRIHEEKRANLSTLFAVAGVVLSIGAAGYAVFASFDGVRPADTSRIEALRAEVRMVEQALAEAKQERAMLMGRLAEADARQEGWPLEFITQTEVRNLFIVQSKAWVQCCVVDKNGDPVLIDYAAVEDGYLTAEAEVIGYSSVSFEESSVIELGRTVWIARRGQRFVIRNKKLVAGTIWYLVDPSE